MELDSILPVPFTQYFHVMPVLTSTVSLNLKNYTYYDALFRKPLIDKGKLILLKQECCYIVYRGQIESVHYQFYQCLKLAVKYRMAVCSLYLCYNFPCLSFMLHQFNRNAVCNETEVLEVSANTEQFALLVVQFILQERTHYCIYNSMTFKLTT